MTPETLTSVRELDSRFTNGLSVKLLWCKHTDQLWVTVVDIRSRDAFCVAVREGERALDVFHHPYAYATQPRIVTLPPATASAADPVPAV